MDCKSLCGNIACKSCYIKSFASIDKSKYLYDKTLNILLISKSSHKKYEFNCDKCNHIFLTALNNITYLNRWCPFCANKTLCDNETCLDCFNKSFASHEKTKYWSKNNHLTPRQIFKNSNKICLIVCETCNHEFNITPNTFINSKGCPFCVIQSKRLCDDICCIPCLNRSFASEKMSINWSDKNEYKPRQVLKLSNKKYWFKCTDCNHEFESSLSHICNGTHCPFCAKYSSKLCDDQDCLYCFNKSFASHPKSKYWSIKNEHKPREFTKYSNNKNWFKCEDCDHTFEKKIADVSNEKWCPYCCIPTYQICTDQNCKHCFNRSFASHECVKYWSKKNALTPREYIKGSSSKCWFNCQYCEFEYEIVLSAINNNKCPLCINKTEKQLYNWLISLYNDVTIQKTFDWCIFKRKCLFDFVIENKKIIIELDGEQHFIQVSSWGTPEDTQKRDIFKMKKANENGYTVIRIFQLDVYRNKNDWQIKLQKAIDTNYDLPQIIYIGNEDLYKIYIEKMSKII